MKKIRFYNWFYGKLSGSRQGLLVAAHWSRTVVVPRSYQADPQKISLARRAHWALQEQH